MELQLNKLNKTFENRIRLGVMSILMVNDWVDFNSLKDLLKITDGNLASHIKALEAETYIEINKQWYPKPLTATLLSVMLGVLTTITINDSTGW